MSSPKSVSIVVLTVSDTRTVKNDTSGQLLADRIAAAGHVLADRRIVPDEVDLIHSLVSGWCHDPNVDVVLSTGGTGITGRDVTADVFESLYTKPIPGFGELFRALSFTEIGPSTIQSRASGGLAETTLLFALPGSTGACRLAWDQILAHQLNSTQKPCNLVALMPRFKE
jgi:molybdenum cofactor biosynthesis protein B